MASIAALSRAQHKNPVFFKTLRISPAGGHWRCLDNIVCHMIQMKLESLDWGLSCLIPAFPKQDILQYALKHRLPRTVFLLEDQILPEYKHAEYILRSEPELELKLGSELGSKELKSEPELELKLSVGSFAHFAKLVERFDVLPEWVALMVLEQNLHDHFRLINERKFDGMDRARHTMVALNRKKLLALAKNKHEWVTHNKDGARMLKACIRQGGDSKRATSTCVLMSALGDFTCERCFGYTLKASSPDIIVRCTDGITTMPRSFLPKCTHWPQDALCKIVSVDMPLEQVQLVVDYLRGTNKNKYLWTLRALLVAGVNARVQAFHVAIRLKEALQEEIPPEHIGPVLMPSVYLPVHYLTCWEGQDKLPKDLLEWLKSVAYPESVSPVAHPRRANHQHLKLIMEYEPSDKELADALPHLTIGEPAPLAYWCAEKGYPLSFKHLAARCKLNPEVILRKLVKMGKLTWTDEGRAAVLMHLPDLVPSQKHVELAALAGLNQVTAEMGRRAAYESKHHLKDVSKDMPIQQVGRALQLAIRRNDQALTDFILEQRRDALDRAAFRLHNNLQRKVLHPHLLWA